MICHVFVVFLVCKPAGCSFPPSPPGGCPAPSWGCVAVCRHPAGGLHWSRAGIGPIVHAPTHCVHRSPCALPPPSDRRVAGALSLPPVTWGRVTSSRPQGRGYVRVGTLRLTFGYPMSVLRLQLGCQLRDHALQVNSTPILATTWTWFLSMCLLGFVSNPLLYYSTHHLVNLITLFAMISPSPSVAPPACHCETRRPLCLHPAFQPMDTRSILMPCSWI